MERKPIIQFLMPLRPLASPHGGIECYDFDCGLCKCRRSKNLVVIAQDQREGACSAGHGFEVIDHAGADYAVFTVTAAAA